MKVSMFVKFSTEKDYLDFQTRGWRDDVIVYIDSKVFNLNVYQFDVFNYTIRTMIKEKKGILMDSNILIVEDMTYKNIFNSIIKNIENEYFNCISPCNIDGNNIELVLNKQTKKTYRKANIPVSFRFEELTCVFSAVI